MKIRHLELIVWCLANTLREKKKNSICLNSNKIQIYFKPYIFNSRDKMFNKQFQLTQITLKQRQNSGEFWCIFFLAILKTNLISQHLSTCNFILNFDFQRFSVLSLKRLIRILFKPHYIISMMYITMSATSTKIDSLQHLKFQEKPRLWTGQKSALQHSLF